MKETLGKVSSFVLSVITRWGTQVAMLRSIQRVQPALQKFFSKLPEDCCDSVEELLDIIWDREFWVGIDFIAKLLIPIDELIKKSESDRSTLQSVIPRWQTAQQHLEKLSQERPDIKDIAEINDRVLKPRFLKQTTAIHIAAHLLNPLSVGNDEIAFLSPGMIMEQIHTFIEKQGMDKVSTMKELWEFRSQEGHFFRGSFLWDYKQDMKTFWQTARAISSVLAPLAIRLASTPSNSVPSERSFSTLKLLHNKLRNRLLPERVDRLQYVYINERVLDRVLAGNQVSGEDDEDLVELEDALLKAGEDHTNNPGLVWIRQ